MTSTARVLRIDGKADYICCAFLTAQQAAEALAVFVESGRDDLAEAMSAALENAGILVRLDDGR